MFIMMLVHFFFFWGGGTMSCLYCSRVALLRILSLFFFLWGIYFYYYFLFIYLLFIIFFFENHGLGLGTALFRLGTQVESRNAEEFNLSWKFFQIFRENLGFETCFKFQFGDSLAWMTIQVSNRG
jgi:hypothetical protein